LRRVPASGYFHLAADSDHGVTTVPWPNEGFVALACGAAHVVAIREDGSVVAWGANDSGQCDVP
jgi:alpha-tubulin suppressor-like RCC1 family protein